MRAKYFLNVKMTLSATESKPTESTVLNYGTVFPISDILLDFFKHLVQARTLENQ